MKTTLIFLILIFALSSCEDIINTEKNIKKTLIQKLNTSSDSLSVLRITSLDLGSVKWGGVSSAFVEIKNLSDSINCEIFSLENTNRSGLFTYIYEELPMYIAPSENTEMSEKIKVKFIASAWESKVFYDTLIINNTPNYYIPISIRVYY